MLSVFVFWGLGIGVLLLALETARRLLTHSPPPTDPASLVALILPCRGIDPDFPVFLEALAGQSLSNHKLYFVIADAGDPAAAVIRAFLGRFEGAGELVIFDPPAGYTGKIANMLGGVAAADGDGAKYFIFLDSDTIPDAEFSAYLVSPLVQEEATLATGARVLVPASGSVPQWVASLWLQSSLPGVTRPQEGSAWGGAMSIRAEDARRLDLARVWLGAFSDDHTLSNAVRAEGGRITFVPHCTISNPSHHTWSDLTDFLVRQLVTIRVHDRRLWLATWIMVYPLLLVVVTLADLARAQYALAAATLLALSPLVIAYYIINEAVWRRLGLKAVHLRAQPLRTQIAAFAVLLVIHPLAMLRSAFLRRFTWRGQEYVIKQGKIEWVENQKAGRNSEEEK